MPKFAYEARNEDGQPMGGVIVAPNLTDAGQRLSQQGLYIIKIGAIESTEVEQQPQFEGASRIKASRNEVMWFMNQLAIMVETGITISDALDILARQIQSPAFKTVLEGVSATVCDGRPLSDAMELYPRTFPLVAVAMIRASEASGTLSMVLNRVSGYMLKDQQSISRLRGAMVYPGFMFLMCVSVTVFLLTVILPRFATIYSNKGAILPLPTRILLTMSGALVQHGLWIVVGLVAVVLAVVFSGRTQRGRVARHWLQLNVPVFGTLFHKLFQSRTFRAVGTLLDAGVPISDAIVLARNMSSNTWYHRMWTRVNEGVINGERVVVPLSDAGLLPEPLIQMIACGDRSGRLPFVFNRLADFLEQEYDRAIRVASQFIEPLMILLMGGIIGFVAIAMLMPMFRLASVVAK